MPKPAYKVVVQECFTIASGREYVIVLKRNVKVYSAQLLFSSVDCIIVSVECFIGGSF